MKNNSILFLINIIISGIIMILYLLYNTTVSDAALIASFVDNIFDVNTTPKEIAKWVYADGIFCIVMYSITNIINYFIYKNGRKELLIVLNILLDIVAIIMIILNIRLFI